MASCPNLVTLADIRGDLQMHTTASDGSNSIEEMGEAARALGYEYIALTDHSQACHGAMEWTKSARSSRSKRFARPTNESRESGCSRASKSISRKMARSISDDEVLGELDVVVASVHSYMNLERAEMTDRILAAIENPYTQIIAHPTGRLVLRRDPFVYDMEKVLDAAAAHGVAMECNAYPDRLDLSDVHLRMAKQRGCKIVISTDSHDHESSELHEIWSRHRPPRLDRKKDVINTLPLEEFLAALRPKPHAAKRKAATQSEWKVRRVSCQVRVLGRNSSRETPSSCNRSFAVPGPGRTS